MSAAPAQVQVAVTYCDYYCGSCGGALGRVLPLAHDFIVASCCHGPCEMQGKQLRIPVLRLTCEVLTEGWK